MPQEPIDPQDETHSLEISARLFSDSLEHGLQAAYGNSTQKGIAAETANRTNAGRIISNRYRLIEKIGEGGMGSVWMAEQFEPLKRLVAIKLIKPGMGSREVLARFQAEQQALAVLDHPNIAKILDAGIDEAGLPYFAMELIKGVPITRYCDERRLGTRERLELFVPICQAIQHAHQKGLIHRDIKPSNILIARFDEVPVPKVIDFGVAKAMGPLLTEATLHTGFNAIVGTLEYMSPEQASFNNRDIDTRTDIYALGAVLYELLVGSPPFQRQELTRLAVDEILKVIRETEPPTPSHKLSSAERREYRRPPQLRTRRAGENLAKRLGLDRHEGVGKGTLPSLRFFVGIGGRHSKVLARGGSRSRAAQSPVSLEEMVSSPSRNRHRRHDPFGLAVGWYRRHDLGLSLRATTTSSGGTKNH